VEQPQSLLAFDAKQPAETLTVGLEVLRANASGNDFFSLRTSRSKSLISRKSKGRSKIK